MTSAYDKPAATAAPSGSPAALIIRVILFALLGYMIFALAYDYMYVFPTHTAKMEEMMALVETETARSADDRKANGPNGPAKVQEIMGFGPSNGLEDMGHYKKETYVYHRGLPFMTRWIDVFYKADAATDEVKKDLEEQIKAAEEAKDSGKVDELKAQLEKVTQPGIYSVAATEEDRNEVTPQPSVVPKEVEPAPEEEVKKDGEETPMTTPVEKTGDTPAEKTEEKEEK
jgi:hypothetical protein